jgi:tripartite-type tricarboxylate transporter receptor subunit TctC
MKLPRRTFLHLAAGAAALPVVTRIARAQTYPSRPVRIVVGFSPGGGADIVARLIGQWLSEHLGQPFIVENRPGAASSIGAEAVVRASPDGYTLLLVTSVNAINATFYDKLNFNLIRDIAPVAGLTRDFLVLVVNPSLPVKAVPELIEYAKANPGKLSMASAGNGSGPHVAGELFKMMTGVNMIHVPYRGSAPALTDLLAGQVHLTFEIMTACIEYIRAGKLRALAVTSPMRLEVLPGVPAMAEYLPGYEASNVRGVGAPSNTPAETIDKLNKEINAGLADPKMQARLADFGGTPLVLSPADFGRLIAENTEKWGKVIRALNIKAD